MPTAHDVARAIRELVPSAGRVKVQKLLYYCQGWHLAFTGQQMFPEEIEAWDLGPVIAEIYRSDKYKGPVPPPAELDDATIRTVSWVASRYGALTASDLVTLSHDAEGPWKATRDAYGPNAAISLDAMTEWFSRELSNRDHIEEDLVDQSGTDELPELLRLLGELTR